MGLNHRQATTLSIAVLSSVAWAYACGDGATEPPPAAPDPSRPAMVAVAPAAVQLTALGATAQLTAEVRDQNGSAMAGAAVSWASSAAAVATVNASGLVTAVGEGTATITAATGGVSGSVAVTVAQEVSVVAVSPAADTLALGDILQLAAEAADANDHRVADAEFSWESGDADVATVDADGLVTAVGEGTATITVTAGAASGSAAVTVANLDPGVLRDRAALIALYEATNGPSWVNSGNWRTAAPLAEWYGVSTDASGRVTGLVLSRNDLSGPIPPELGNLVSLRRLSLDGNALAGPLPPSLLKIDGLNQLHILSNAGLCVRATEEFITWLRRIENRDDESESLCNGAGATAWVSPPVADPYPIRLHWGECPINYRYEGCVPVDNPRERWGDLLVDGAEYAVEQWSRVLHPTPRDTWVAPLEGWDNNWPNKNTPPHLWGITPGETIAPGLDVFVTGITNEEDCGWTCATGSAVQPPGGHLAVVRMAHLVVDSRMQNQDWTSLHELGHAIAMSGTGKRAWRDNIVKLPLSPDAQAQYGADSVYVQTHPALIDVYEKYGGGAWEWVGKGIGVAMDPHGSNHWNDCAAPQDMMGPRRFRPTADPTLDVVTWISPLTAQAATVHGGFTVDMKQLRPTDYHIPHYWNDQGNRICGVMTP